MSDKHIEFLVGQALDDVKVELCEMKESPTRKTQVQTIREMIESGYRLPEHSDIKKGSVIIERKYGHETSSVIFTDVVENDRGQLVFKSITESGRVIDYIKSKSSLEVVG